VYSPQNNIYSPFHLVLTTTEARRVKSALVKKATLIALVGVG
jgi:hypothetical protein